MMKKPIIHYLQGQIKGCAIVLLITVLSGCQGQSIPNALMGTWVNDKPEYEDCFLKITQLYIVFGDREKNNKEYEIKKVSISQENQMLQVTINSVNTQKEPLSVVLLHSGEEGGYLMLKNQPGFKWKLQKLL